MGNEIQIDPSITMAVIVALMALISPVFVAFINNKYQKEQRGKEREKEIQLHKYDSYYKNQTIIFEQLLETVGDFLGDNKDMGKYPKAMACINKAYAYSDEELTSHLDTLKILVGFFGGITEGDCSVVEALESLKEVANHMNVILKRNADIE